MALDDDGDARRLISFITTVLAGEAERDYVIRGHLYIEHELTQLVSLAVPYPKALQKPRMSFDHKVALAVALGCVDPSERGAFELLDRIRNQFAHKLDRELTDKDGHDLVNALGPEAREAYDELTSAIPPDAPPINKLKRAIGGMWVTLGHERRWTESNPDLAPYLREDRARRKGMRAVRDDESSRPPQ